jgi:CHASE3 domain sensor protein
MSTRAKIISGYVVALAMLAAIGGVAFFEVRNLIESARWTAHTHEVLESVSSLEADLNFVETAARGYIISGDPFYLTEFNSQIETGRAILAQTRGLTSDNAAQQPRLDKVATDIEQLFTDLSNLITVRDDQGLLAATEMFGQGAGTGSMGTARLNWSLQFRGASPPARTTGAHRDGSAHRGVGGLYWNSCWFLGTHSHMRHRPSQHIPAAPRRY